MRWPKGVPLALVAVSLAAAACSSGGPGDLAGKTPTQILAAGIAAGEAQVGVHYVIKAAGGSSTQTVTGDAARNAGVQTVVTGSNAVEVVLLSDGSAYLRGNMGGLEQTVGLPNTVAPTYADKWISVAHSDPLYQPLTEFITVRGILTQLSPSRPLQASTPGTVDGQIVIGVRGGLPGSAQPGITGNAVLYVSTAAPTVPVGFTGRATNTSTTVNDTGTFTRWGEQVRPRRPAGATPFSQIPRS